MTNYFSTFVIGRTDFLDLLEDVLPSKHFVSYISDLDVLH